jgi:hypothetical protein
MGSFDQVLDFSLSLTKSEILLREKAWSLRTFTPDFLLQTFTSENPETPEKCGDSGLSSGFSLGLFDCASASLLSLP